MAALEVVRVQHYNTREYAVPRRPARPALQRLVGIAPIEKAGERSTARQAGDYFAPAQVCHRQRDVAGQVEGKRFLGAEIVGLRLVTP